MRIKLTDTDRKLLFSTLQARFGNRDGVAAQIGVSGRTVTDWRSGKYLMSEKNFKKLSALSELPEGTFTPELLSDFWNIHEAARQGGLRRLALYGDLGTPEGRKKGGR